VRVEDLVSPRNTAEVFEDDPDALFLKPYMTGDLFADVPDPDEPDRTLTVAIVGHPCAIRGHGGQLKTRIPCCIVNQVATAVPYDEWPDGNFDLFPVGDELGLGERLAVRFLEFTSVHRRELQRSRRVAALTPRGVYVFYQRFSHSLTRVAFPLAAYEAGTRHIVEEAELESEWVEQLAGDDRGEKQLDKHVKAFHKFLDEVVDGEPRRAALKREGGHSALRKELRGEMKRLATDE